MTARPKINEAFRSWTRGVQFSLQMGRGQVATLVAIHAGQGSDISFIGSGHPRLRLFVVSGQGLIERGLVGHTGKRWCMTDAGEHVVALLKLSGVYQEIESELRAYETEMRSRWARSA